MNECHSGSCKIYKRRHNTMLHIGTQQTLQNAALANAETEVKQQAVSLTLQNVYDSHVLLSTVQIQIYDNIKRIHNARTILDAGFCN